MRAQLKDIASRILVTLILLLILNIISTALLPVFGLNRYMIPFNIMIVLFLGFKLETEYIAVLVGLVQYCHGFFSVEGWEVGTIAGISICFIVSYVKELIHFSSAGVTIVVTQIFQVLWFLIVASLIYMKGGEWSYLVGKFWRFIPESIIISLLAPFFFSLLDRIWQVGAGSSIEGNA